MNTREKIMIILLLPAVLAAFGGIGLMLEKSSQTREKTEVALVLSAESGFYDEDFELTITAPEGTSVYYTLDGSRPTPDSFLYSAPVPVTARAGDETDVIHVQNMRTDWQEYEGETHPREATVIRAAAFDGAGNPGEIVTAVYFVGVPEYEDKLVISLAADPEDLFGDRGIYVTGKEYDDWYLAGGRGRQPEPNFSRRGREWERPAVLEMFEGGSVLKQPVGIRIQGGSTRGRKNKRFSVYAREEYGGSNWFDKPVFGRERTHSFVLRSGFESGTLELSGYMNGYIQQLVQDRDVASARSREAVVFLNGARWYSTIVQEKYSPAYFGERYGLREDNVVIVKDGEPDSGREEDKALYQDMYNFLAMNDLSDPRVYERFGKTADIQSYIDYCCVNVYFANMDYSEWKNCVCWRARQPENGTYGDSRWRWALYDMDLLNDDYGIPAEEINTFTTDTRYAGKAFNTRLLYRALRKNSRFCRQFVISFMDMVNTDFTAENGAAVMEEWGITREWGGWEPGWAEAFFPARTKNVIRHLAEEFGLRGTCESVTLSVNDQEAGHIVLNTITPPMTDGRWSGMYFTDYPVTVTAVAGEGRTFAGWKQGGVLREELSGETAVFEIPAGGLELEAVFR